MMFVKAFVVGGTICALVQVLLEKTKITAPRILVMLVISGVALGFLGLYAPLKEFCGAGATVPLTGFGAALAKGAIDGAKQSGIIGAFSGGLKSTAGGVSAAIVFGYLAAVFFRPKTKP